ncbi:MAG TPA: hypothetical protein VLB47_05185 [Solirubrobacteraceae bacterium]|nr:hypothetical protein [Solirubrobacteraceae bacterium]
MTALDAARGIALGRVALGAGLLLAPARLGRPWIGAVADRPAAQVALRGLGARDVLLGGIALHLAGRGPAGARAVMACAAADAADAAATLAARRSLPPLGAAAVVALAGGGAVAGLAAGRALAAG